MHPQKNRRKRMSVALRPVCCGNRNQVRAPRPREPEGRIKQLTAAASIFLCLSMIASIGTKIIQKGRCDQWNWEVEDAELEVVSANLTLGDIQERYKKREEMMVQSEREHCRHLNKINSKMLKNLDAFPTGRASYIRDIEIECASLAMNRVELVRSLDPNLCEMFQAKLSFPEEHTPLVCYAKQERDAQAQLKKRQDRLAAQLAQKPHFCSKRKQKRMY